MSLWHGIRSHVAADVRDEIESHVAMQAADLVAEGWSREAALEEARRRFGDRERIEREMLTIDRRREARARRLELLGDVATDARLALRQLRRRPGFALAAIVVIALGVGANSAVFAVVDGALLRPLPFPGGDRLVALFDQQEETQGLPASLPELRDWQRDNDFLDSLIGTRGQGMRLATGDGWDVVRAVQITGDPRGTLGRDPLLGRWFNADELRGAAHVVLLDESLWRERYGARRDVVGSEIELGTGTYTVIGVVPRAAALLDNFGPVKLWLPFVEAPDMERGLHFIGVIGRLKDGVTIDGARRAAEVMAARLRASGVTRHGLTVVPLREVLVGDSRPVFLVLAGGAVFVLLIVCANLANLFLSRFQERGRELAVRAALGASRGRLVRQVLTESVVVAVLGGAAGLALAQVMLAVVRTVAHRAGGLAPASSLDPRVVGFSVLSSLVVGLLFGLWPALRAARVDVGGALKEAGRPVAGGRGAGWRRKALVGAEVALSVTLLAGTGLLVQSLVHMLDENPGFARANVLTAQLLVPDEQRAGAFVDELRQRVLALPGVTAAGVGSELPLARGDTNGSFGIVGRDFPVGHEPNARKRLVGPGYFAALGIPLLRGRDFAAGDRPGARDVVIISESIARRFWPDQDPVGKSLKFDWGPGDEDEIVGVVGDVRQEGLDQPADGILYRPVAQFPQRWLSLVVRALGAPQALEHAVRGQVVALDASVALFDVRTMASLVAESVAPRRSLLLVLGGFAVIAMLLAAVGAYAVTAQLVAQRTREIGLRIACGAQQRDILRLVLGEGGAMIVAGVVVGLAGALAATRALAGMLYAVAPGDPPTLLAASALLAVISVAAIYVPARRAARMDPMTALRVE